MPADEPSQPPAAPSATGAEGVRTVNAQLRAKMEEHQATSSDLSSLLTSTDIAVLFLDPALRVRRFTPAVRDLIDLLPTDVGRPLMNLTRTFDDPHLDADCRAVLERPVPVAREVPAAGGRHYLRRVLPYRTADDRIDGAVVTFVDVTERKQAERALAAEKEYAESIVETLHEPLLVLHPDLTVKGVNPAFYTHFRVDPADTVGRKVYDLGNGQWNIPALRTLLEDVLPDSNVFNDYEVTHEFEGLGRRVMLVNGRRLDHVQLILLGIRDITERKRAEDALRAGEELFRAALAASPVVVFEQDRALRYTWVHNPALGFSASDVLGRTDDELFERPEDAERVAAVKRAVLADGAARRQEVVVRRAGGTHSYDLTVQPRTDAAGAVVGVACAAVDVTARKRAEERQAFLLNLSDALRPLDAVAAIQGEATRLLREHLAAGWCYYVEWDEAAARGVVLRDATRDGLPSLVGAHDVSDVPAFLDTLRTGRVLNVGDYAGFEGLSTELRARYTALGFRSMLVATLVKQGRLVASLLVGDTDTRDWSSDAEELLTEVAERTWAAVERKRAEDARRDSHTRFLSVANLVPDLLWSSRPDGYTDFYNQRWTEYTGQTPEEALGWGWTGAIHPDDREGSARRYREAAEAGRALVQEHRIRRRDGEYRWFLVRAEPVRDGAGGTTMFGSATDIHDQRTLLATARAGEERQAFLLRFSDALRAEPDAGAVIDRALQMLIEHFRLDRSYIVSYRLPDDRADLIHQVGNETVPPLPDVFVLSDYPEAFRATLDRTLVIEDELERQGLSEAERRNAGRLGMRAMVAATLRAGPGRPMWSMVAISSAPRRWAPGEVALVEEVTERTWAAVERARAEAALRVSEEKYRVLFESMDEGYCVSEMLYDPAGRPIDWRFLEVNPAFERHNGLTGAVGKTIRELTPDIEPKWAEVYARVAETGEARRFEEHSAALGRTFDLFAHRVGAPGARKVAVLFTDVTARKAAEAALRESEERLRAVAANLPSAAVFVVGPDLRYALAEGQALRAAGLNPSDLEGRTVAEAVGPDLAGEYEPRYRAALGGAPFRAEHEAHGRHFASHGVPLRDAAGAVTAALAVSYDITDRVRAEDARRAGEERFRRALAAARMGVWALEPATGVQTRDGNLNRLLGLAPVDTEQPFDEFLTHVHPDDRAAVADGFAASDRENRPLRLEFRVTRPDGAVRWLRDQGDVFGGGTGRRMTGACVDVTERREAEDALRRARDELERRVAERTAELGTALESLEAEMARRADLARRLSTAQEDERKRVARDLHDSVGQLLAGLALAFKAVAGAAVPAPVAAKLADAQRVADALGKEVHALAVRLRPTSLDDIGLEAALAQLVREWADRTGVKGEFHVAGIEAHRLPADVETVVYRAVQEALTNVARHARATAVGVVVRRPDGFVSVVVEDNGSGFDPTAATDRLGLLGMRERVTLVGGELEIESRPGAGTSIIITIPIPTEGET